MPNGPTQIPNFQLRRPERLQTHAAPVNTFVRGPSVPQENGAEKLARALASFNPKLIQYLDEKEQADARGGKKEGTQLADTKTYQQAVDEGLIGPQKNPYRNAAFYFRKGELEASNYSQFLAQKYATEFNPDSDRIADFVTTQRAAYLEQLGGPHAQTETFREGFFKHSQGFEAQVISKEFFATEQRFREAERQDVANQYAQTLTDGRALGWDTARIAQELTSLNNREHRVGMGGSEANKLTVDTLTDLAVSELDTGILGVLEQVDSAPGVKLAGTAYAKEQIAKAKSKIFDQMATLQRWEYQQEERREKEQIEARTLDIMARVSQAPNPALVDMRELTAGLPAQEAGQMYAYQTRLIEGDQREDLELVTELTAGVYEQAGGESLTDKEDVLRHFIAGDINRSTFDDLRKRIEARENPDHISNNVDVKMVGSGLVSSIRGGELTSSATNSRNAELARNRFYDEMMEFMEQNPTASKKAIRKEAQEVAESLYQTYGDVKGYARDMQRLERRNAAADAQGSQAQQPAPAAQPVPQPTPDTPSASNWETQPVAKSKAEWEAMVSELTNPDTRASSRLVQTMKRLGVTNETYPAFMRAQQRLMNEGTNGQ